MRQTASHINNRETRHQYTECGLSNIWIQDGIAPLDDKGNEVYGIQNISGLHKVIAFCIVMKDSAMTGAELRFLRTEMGYTQTELAELINNALITIGRWERGEKPIDSNADAVIRMLAFENLKLKGNRPKIEDLIQRCLLSAEERPITIDGSDPKNYRPVLVA